MRALKLAAPWWLKIAAKIVLSRMRVSYQSWSRLNLFKHGAMVEVRYARHVFERHVTRYPAARGVRGRTLLELGPGDSITSAILGRINGASSGRFIDAGAFAHRDPSLYATLTLELG